MQETCNTLLQETCNIINSNSIVNSKKVSECAHTHTHEREGEGDFEKSEFPNAENGKTPKKHQVKTQNRQKTPLDAKTQHETTEYADLPLESNTNEAKRQICENTKQLTPAEKNIERLKAEIESQKAEEARSQSVKNYISFSDSATPRFRAAVMAYIEKANSVQYNTYTAKSAQLFADAMDRHACYDFANFAMLLEMNIDAYDAVAYAVEQATIPPKQWNVKHSLVKDLIRQFCQNAKADAMEAQKAAEAAQKAKAEPPIDLPNMLKSIGYTVEPGSVNNLILAAQRMAPKAPEQLIKERLFALLSNEKVCERSRKSVNAVALNFNSIVDYMRSA